MSYGPPRGLMRSMGAMMKSRSLKSDEQQVGPLFSKQKTCVAPNGCGGAIITSWVSMPVNRLKGLYMLQKVVACNR